MEIFFLTLKQMLMMFFLILAGILLRKKSLLPDNAHITMSKLETFVFVPALSLFNQITKCNVQTFVDNSALMLYGLVLILGAILLSAPLSRLFIHNANQSPSLAYQRSVYLIINIRLAYSSMYGRMEPGMGSANSRTGRSGESAPPPRSSRKR